MPKRGETSDTWISCHFRSVSTCLRARPAPICRCTSVTLVLLHGSMPQLPVDFIHWSIGGFGPLLLRFWTLARVTPTIADYAAHTIEFASQKATSHSNESSKASNSSFNCTQQAQLASATCVNHKYHAEVTSSIHSSEYHQLLIMTVLTQMTVITKTFLLIQMSHELYSPRCTGRRMLPLGPKQRVRGAP